MPPAIGGTLWQISIDSTARNPRLCVFLMRCCISSCWAISTKSRHKHMVTLRNKYSLPRLVAGKSSRESTPRSSTLACMQRTFRVKKKQPISVYSVLSLGSVFVSILYEGGPTASQVRRLPLFFPYRSSLSEYYSSRRSGATGSRLCMYIATHIETRNIEMSEDIDPAFGRGHPPSVTEDTYRTYR